MIRREAILARIRVIIGAIAGLNTGSAGEVTGASRNRDVISRTARPAVVQWDGAENRADGARGPKRSAHQLMELHPQFWILVGKPDEEVGTAANGFLGLLQDALLEDAELLDLLNGEPGHGDRGIGNIRYDSASLDLTQGENPETRMVVDFTFWYPFIRGEQL